MMRLLLSVYNVPTVVWVEIARVTEHLEESANSFFSLLLGFFLHVNIIMHLVKMRKDFIHKLEEFEWCFIIELNHAEMLHKWRSVELVYYLFNLSRA